VTVVEVEEIVPVGQLDPEAIVTPSIFVQRVVLAPRGSPSANRGVVINAQAARKQALSPTRRSPPWLAR
jgi:3-oxoacid CoA-transferase subunit A